jgi:hypothetical protein
LCYFIVAPKEFNVLINFLLPTTYYQLPSILLSFREPRPILWREVD